jgi:hypothetical protein
MTTFDRNDPSTWPDFKPVIIAHDVARSRDRSTAVVGGPSHYQPRLFGIAQLEELPIGLSGSQRASALAAVDRLYYSNSLIVADLSNDPSYAEDLWQMFGPRIVGLHITRHGDGMNCERRQVPGGAIFVYSIGRTTLIENYLAELERGDMRIVDNEMSRRAYQQLADLEVVEKETGRFYNCLSGRHDDLGISCAMLAWAARHQHLPVWVRISGRSRTKRWPRQQYGWEAFVKG